VLYQIAFLQGDAEAMRREMEWAKGTSVESLFQLLEARTRASEGRLRQAREGYARAFDLAKRAGFEEQAAGVLATEALTEAILGQSVRAREKAKAAVGSSRGGLIAVDASLALVLAGALDEARPPLEDVAKRFPVNTLYQKIALPTARAAIELQRGNPAKVSELLEDTARYELGSIVAYFSIYLRALAHQKAGAGQDAEREYQKILDHRGVDAFSLLQPLSRLGLARAAALSGDVARSRRAYQDFLAHWKDADADLAVLREAQAEYAKLKDR
jgi:hypothetical protein